LFVVLFIVERMQQVEINKLDSSEDTCQGKKKVHIVKTVFIEYKMWINIKCKRECAETVIDFRIKIP
jgi:hypothetical protein